MGGYTEKVLEWFKYPRARAHPGCEVNCQGVLYRHFALHRGQPDSGEAVSYYKADQLVASLPSFRSIQSSLAVRKFCARQGKNAANEATDGCVRTFDA